MRAADLVRHCEQNQCIIDSNKLAEVREQRISFARALQARHFGDYDEEAETPLMSHNATLRPKAEATVRPYPVQFDPYVTDTHNVYAYYESIKSRRGMGPDNARSAQQTPQASPARTELPSSQSSSPINIHEWQEDVFREDQPQTSLLEDFVPTEHPGLQPSLIDYAEAGEIGQRGPWSVDFNPWENDDLAGMSSRASSRAASPDYSEEIGRAHV